MWIRKLFAAFACCFAFAAAPAGAEPFRTENVEIELHANRAAIAPGERFTIVLRQNIREHWHTYWRNPGDSGEPTEVLSWDLPQGFNAGPIQWPAPEPMRFDIIFSYVYSNEILLPMEFTAPSNARVGDTAIISGEFYWLVCADVCIPEQGRVSIALPIEAAGRDDPVWAPRIAATLEALPRRAEFDVRFTPGEPARLTMALPNASAIRNPFFFPYDQNTLEHGADQSPRTGPGGLSFSLTEGVDENLGEVPIEGVVAYDVRDGAGWTRRAVEIRAEPGRALSGTSDSPANVTPDLVTIWTASGAAPAVPEATASAATGGAGAFGLLALIAAALLGGLILNVMPCVLPVISIKALSLAHGAQAGEARRHGLLYTGGVLATFLALAGVLIALRSAGEAVGWGFQLQEPWIVAALALLFFVIALNLLGVFEIGGSLQDAGGGLAGMRGDAGAFFTGALAVIAATPCTAPFMAGATGAVLTQSAGATLLIFAALGVGFALPFLVLSFAPGLQRLMPKPGPWMEKFKNILAFPMFAAAILLAWVLTEQTGSMGVLALLSIAAAIAFALFVARWGRIWTIIGIVTLAATLVFAWRPLTGAALSAAEAAQTLTHEDWSPERLAQIRADGRAVLVNFTAAWCVTCKVNEAVALSSPRVAAAFAATNVAYLKGDWTNRDADIAAALAEHGRAGVPLYLYYAPGADQPVLLPQLLTESLILQTIEGAPR